MNSNQFYKGQKIRSIFWAHDEGVLTAGVDPCESITVVMENGQCAGVPWFLITYTDSNRGPTKFNGAMVGGVVIFEEEEG